jgi:hypothetical protein
MMTSKEWYFSRVPQLVKMAERDDLHELIRYNEMQDTMRDLRHSTAGAPESVRNIVSQLISHPYVNRMERQVRIYCCYH